MVLHYFPAKEQFLGQLGDITDTERMLIDRFFDIDLESSGNAYANALDKMGDFMKELAEFIRNGTISEQEIMEWVIKIIGFHYNSSTS